MSRSRTLAPTLGLAAFAALSSFAAPPAHAQTVTITDLSPAGFTESGAFGALGGTQVGYASRYDANGFAFTRALLWKGTAASSVDLTPPHFEQGMLLGISADSQVGIGYSKPRYHYHALLWHGTADGAIDLSANVTFYSGVDVEAVGVSGDTQVGYIHYVDPDFSGNDSDTAILWHGTADSMTILNPANPGTGFYYNSQALAVSEDTQVGYIQAPQTRFNHAALWHGTADSVVDLNPDSNTGSTAYGVSGNTQVGESGGHATLWHGTASSAADLHPTLFSSSAANAAASDVQVGDGLVYGNRNINDFERHALLWRGTAESLVDLNAFLPAALRGYSSATGVTGSNGIYDVVGTAADATNTPHAVLWHIVYAAPTLTSLVPASRTEGRDGFPLTVGGKNFTKASVIRWNGETQKTVYVSPTQLSAVIPAFLIAHAGTAQLTVSTPGLGTSNARTETINPRPVISSLSPASKKVGDRLFNMTVTGTGFLRSSIVKFNGMSLGASNGTSTSLTVTVPTSLLKTAGTFTVTVTTPDVATSAGKAFTVTP